MCDDATPRRCQYKEELDLNPLTKNDFLTQLRSKYVTLNEESDRLIREAKISDKHNHELTEKILKNVVERTRRHLKLTEVAIEDPPPVIESSESEEEEEEEEIKLPEITDEMEEASTYTPTFIISFRYILVSFNKLDFKREVHLLAISLLCFIFKN